MWFSGRKSGNIDWSTCCDRYWYVCTYHFSIIQKDTLTTKRIYIPDVGNNSTDLNVRNIYAFLNSDKKLYTSLPYAPVVVVK
jgi:hypothetical protein